MTDTKNTVSDERLAEMLAGLEGVSPGPWDTTAGLVRSIDGEEAIPIFESRDPWKKHRRTATVMRQEWHNRQHIARCDPDTIRSLITELQSLRASTIEAQVLRLTEENEALRKERDEAQANAYRSDKAADALNIAVKDAGDRAAAMWSQFRDLRTEIIGDGPMCRDCADFDGRCQGNGPPCDPDEAAKEKLAEWKAAEARIQALEDALRPFAERLPESALRFADGTMAATTGIDIKFFRAARSVLKENAL